jgi:hypothetical protein
LAASFHFHAALAAAACRFISERPDMPAHIEAHLRGDT